MKCERCQQQSSHLVTCVPCFEAPEIEVCEECADALRWQDYYVKDNEDTLIDEE